MRPSTYFVMFGLDGQKYALHLSATEFVVRAVEITRLPQSPDSVAGIIDLHGQIVPVFNLRRRFRLPEREIQFEDHIIFARTARRVVALVVDAVDGVLECADGDAVPAEAVLPGTAYLAGVVKRPDGLILIHDLNSFLSLDEERTLEAALASA
ncbi:MAG: chemotaxis protein CheW [Kiritimatiellia bacterium]